MSGRSLGGEQHAGPREQNGRRHEAAARQCIQGAGRGPARPERMSSRGRGKGHGTLGGHNKHSWAVAEWTEGPVGSFAQRKDQKQDLTCKEIPLAAFLTLLTRGSCSGKGGRRGARPEAGRPVRAGIREGGGCRGLRAAGTWGQERGRRRKEFTALLSNSVSWAIGRIH